MRTLTLASATLLLGGLFASTAAAQMSYPSAPPAALPGGAPVLTVADNQVPQAPQGAAVAPACREETACVCDNADDGFRLFRSPRLAARGINVGGWLDQGFTWNSDSPSNRFNGPVGFNDRSNEYQMNQLYLFAEKKADNCGCGYALGGRIDALYGTDYRYVRGLGLESNWNQDERFYGLAMPQAYGDIAINDLTIRAGRFYAPVGYESVMSPQNFFYSHSYTFQYGEPFTLTGIEGIYKLNDRLSVMAGAHQGWDVVTDSQAQPGMLMGMTWNINEKNDLAWTLVTGNEPNNQINQYRTLSSFVLTHKFSDRFRYVFQTDLGHEDNADLADGGTGSADWYGLVNYLIYDLNPCWSMGMRYEYFVDKNGARVANDDSHFMALGGVPCNWQEVSLGVNYKPNNNVLVRSELRWDNCDPRVSVSDGPFNDYHSRDQFLWGTDLIVKY